MDAQQLERMATGKGFIAALDQSGGSTPRALAAYGIDESAYSTDEQMFDLIHQMRARIMTSPAFTGEHILAAILFEQTMDREVDGIATSDYLWQRKGIVPFLKVDKGLAGEQDGVQLMKPIPDLDTLLARAVSKNIFGTKMRSVIATADGVGIEAIVSQQFSVAGQILDHGLVPIIEPEVDIHSATKAEAEQLLRSAILGHLGDLGANQKIMLKLSIPDGPDFYRELIDHPNVLRVVALSGGYTRAEADALLAKQPGLIASFSRALTEGLSAQQSDDEFNTELAEAIKEIYAASVT